MHRPLPAYLAVVAIAFCILFGGTACGGGGSSSSGGTDTTGNPGTTGTPAVVALVAVASDGLARDFSNTVAGESLSIRALVVDTSGVGTFQTVSNAATSAPASIATVSASSATLTANSGSVSNYAITARYKGQTLSATLLVSAAGSRLDTRGRVQSTGGAAIAGATVFFYDASNNLVGQVRSGIDGQYQANLPSTTSKLTTSVSALVGADSSSRYYSTYFYSSDYYDSSFANCATPLANFAGGQLSPLVFTARGSTIPPPPSGCGGTSA